MSLGDANDAGRILRRVPFLLKTSVKSLMIVRRDRYVTKSSGRVLKDGRHELTDQT